MSVHCCNKPLLTRAANELLGRYICSILPVWRESYTFPSWRGRQELFPGRTFLTGPSSWDHPRPHPRRVFSTESSDAQGPVVRNLFTAVLTCRHTTPQYWSVSLSEHYPSLERSDEVIDVSKSDILNNEIKKEMKKLGKLKHYQRRNKARRRAVHIMWRHNGYNRFRVCWLRLSFLSPLVVHFNRFKLAVPSIS